MLRCLLFLMAVDWPQFRGPDSSGVADGKPLPVEFGSARNVIWKSPAPMGKSSPVFAGNRIFLTGHDGEKLLTLAFDLKTGREIWRREIMRDRKEPRHKLNDAAAPSPSTDGRNVYAFFADFGLAAYDLDGKELWRLPMGPFVSLQGVAASPLLMGDRLFVVCDQTRDSYIAAIDKLTGKVLWKKERQPAPTGSYSSPNRFGDQVVVSGPFDLVAYQPATGEKLWWVGGLPGQPKSFPVVADGVVYTSGKGGVENNLEIIPWAEALPAYDKDMSGKLSPEEMPVQLLRGLFRHLDTSGDGALQEGEWNTVKQFFAARSTIAAIKPKGSGDLTSQAVLWRFERNIPDVPTPLIYRGVAYMVQSGGILTALDTATGKVLKQGRLQQALGDYYASPVAGDGKIFALSQAGRLSVLRAGAEWEVIATSDMEEDCYATPAIVDGRIYLRTGTTLYAFGTIK